VCANVSKAGTTFQLEAMTAMQHHDEETALRSYLLGLASAEEQKRVEQRLLTDSDYCDELERVEECLTDEYVRGEIQGIEKEQFDRHFLKSAEHREGLEFARLLERHFSERYIALKPFPPPAPKWRRAIEIALLSAAIALIAACVLLFRQVSNLHAGAARLEQQRVAADERAQSLARQLAEQGHLIATLKQELATQEKVFATTRMGQMAGLSGASEITGFSLSPGLDRTGAKVRRVIIPPQAQVLRLELKLEGVRYRHYRAQVETVEGDVVWTAGDLIGRPAGDSRRRAIALLLPVAVITHSEYLIKVAGIPQSGAAESVGTYYLNVAQPEVQHHRPN
jgi:hypothetical protein